MSYEIRVTYCGASNVVSLVSPVKYKDRSYARKRGMDQYNQWRGSLHCLSVQLIDKNTGQAYASWTVEKRGSEQQKAHTAMMLERFRNGSTYLD